MHKSDLISIQDRSEQQRLLITVILNFIITVVEIIGGILSNSLSLLSDALHNLSDGLAVLIAYIAKRISGKDSSIINTFGYKRIEILAALLNGVILVAVCIFLFFEAFKRLAEPSEVKGLIMIIVAIIGFAANLLAVRILKKYKKGNINIRAAYLHLLGDTLSSVAVIIGGILIYFFNIYWVDPVITILIGLYIIKETYDILSESVEILMQSTPRNIDILQIQKEVENIPKVKNIHHVHVWNLNDREIHFEAHVDLHNDELISDSEKVRVEIENILKNKYQISHITVQMEYDVCYDKAFIYNGKSN